MNNLQNAFHAVRALRPHMSASVAIAAARSAISGDGGAAMAAAGVRVAQYQSIEDAAKYGYTPPGAPLENAEFFAGATPCRWIEKPERLGWRDCGDAHVIASRRVDHRGWYCEAGGSGRVAVGCVYRWGRYYVPCVRDPNGCGGIVAAWGDRIECADGADDCDAVNSALRDAASIADHVAERYADAERAHDAASAAGCGWAAVGEDLTRARASVRQLLRDLRGIATMPASVCDALRASVRQSLREIDDMRRQRAQLASGDYVDRWLPGFDTRDPDMVATFCDAAGVSVARFGALS